MPEDNSIPSVDFFDALKKSADAIKAAADAIIAVEQALGAADRSVVLQINNTTTRTLNFSQAAHAHGGFAEPPPDKIGPGKTQVIGSRSSGLATGTEGELQYNVEGTDIFYTIHWINPFFGSNTTDSRLEGDGSELAGVFHIGANGNTHVPMRYMIGERIAAAAQTPDWKICDKCKSLYFSPNIETSDCPAGGRHQHVSQSLNYRLPFGVDGLSHQKDWRLCVRCAGLFFNGSQRKGVCPAPVPPFHEGEAPFFLSHSFTHPMPPDATHEPNWRFCIDCFALFFEPKNTGGCRANNNGGGPHRPFPPGGLVAPHPLSHLSDQRPFNYSLSHDIAPQPPDHQAGWRRCGRCAVLFFEPDINESRCPKGGPHQVDPTGHAYQVSTVEPPPPEDPRAGASLQWSKCRKCKTAFFSFSDLSISRCTVSNPPDFRGPHQAGATDFKLGHDFEGPGQNQWKFCKKCNGLVFDPQSAEAPCAAGGKHVLQGFDFRLNHA
jgi:hypothetical protein